jgi:hypothetical protein
MEKSLNKIITAILSGDDYRPYVLDTINKRFIDNVHSILIMVFEARKRNVSPDWWRDELISLLQKKDLMLWFSGLNKKTIRSMTGRDKREVCLNLGRQNFQSIQSLLNEISGDSIPHIEVRIRYRGQEVKLSEGESILLMNTIASMKLAIQGGAWSEVGKKAEKRLLFTIFEMLAIPRNQYVLVFDEMAKKGLVGNREIDAIVFSDNRQRKLQIELKLLAGNPEIGDEALARGVDLFLVDRSSPMMIEEGNKRGVTTIEFRGQDALSAIYAFLQKSGVTVQKPKLTGIAKKVFEIGQRYDESRERDALLQKAKELLA